MNVLFILGHPARKRKTLCESFAEIYGEGAATAGHSIKTYKLSSKVFDPILHEGVAEPQEIEPDILEAIQLLGWADHIVILYPLWEFMIPALLKGFLERVLLRCNTVKNLPPHITRLNNKSVHLVQTSGMPGLLYRFYFMAHGAKALRDMLYFCGAKSVRITCFGSVESATQKQYARWESQLKRFGRKLR